MSIKVHLYREIVSNNPDGFTNLLDPGIEITTGKTLPSPAKYEILVNPNPSLEWIEASSVLRAIVIPWAGIPDETRSVMAQYPKITVHNLHHNAYNTAELGLALLLAAAKFLIPLDQALRKNDWRPRYQPQKSILLRGKAALILGFGAIGQAICEYCSSLGMQVIATRKHLGEMESHAGIEVYPDDQIHDLLPKAEILFICLPLTKETENLIDANELQLMPEGSILINIGRGAIVNQYALYDALKTQHLRAAGSDVWYNYPDSKDSRQKTPPADVPLGKLENFVLSPHRGGMVEEVEQQRASALAKLLNAANRGEPIPNRVDLDAGY